jgi:hypothetical protein
MIAASSSAFGVLGTIVGAYFGVRAANRAVAGPTTSRARLTLQPARAYAGKPLARRWSQGTAPSEYANHRRRPCR